MVLVKFCELWVVLVSFCGLWVVLVGSFVVSMCSKVVSRWFWVGTRVV